MASENALRTYPRGFLGGDLKPQLMRSPDPYGEKKQQHQYVVNDHNTSNTSIAANPVIESIYSEYIKGSVNTDSFSFHKQVLIAALNAFGTNNFFIWFYTQFKSPAAGDLHNRFLTDTLRFIQTGRREMSLETWGALITITDEGNNIGQVNEYAQKFFNITGNVNDVTVQKYIINTNLVEVIQQWCSKQGGIEDLLGTLHILFGDI